MRACLFGTYNRRHTANRIYAAAARAAGFELVEIHEPYWEKTRGKDAGYFAPSRLVAHAATWVVAATRLTARWLRSGGAPVVIIGFNGQLDILLLRAISRFSGPRIVFAPLVSLTETLVEDRGVFRRGSLAARALRAIDRITCAAADIVVADTRAHRQYFISELGIDPAKLVVCHLGVDNRAFGPSRIHGRTKADSPDSRVDVPAVEVLYFGEYLPLHGLDVVVDAVGRLSTRRDIRFTFIGSGEHRPHFERLLRATRARLQFIDWVGYEELGRKVAEADIVLGVFGASQKARMVIANKVWEAAAEARAVITMDCEAVREVFTDGKDIVLVPPNGAELAGAIRELADSAERREEIGSAAGRLIAASFDDESLGRAWSVPLGGDGVFPRRESEPRVGVAIVNFNDAPATLRCLASVDDCDYDNLDVLVVDNGSNRHDVHVLEGGMDGGRRGELERLNHNSGYTGANNLAMSKLFGRGCEYVLVLNNDTLLTPDAVRVLVDCAERNPSGGPIGPRIARDWPGAKSASLGERFWPAVAWAPRSLLRYRWPRQRSYRVSGVMGCAMLLSRSCWEKLGGFDDRYFAYYDEVEYCLRARRAGMSPRVEPMAEIAHRGHRGFGGGFSRVAAYLKARNLWSLGRRETGLIGRPVFVIGYFMMIAASVGRYLVRGDAVVVRSILEGVAAGMGGATGPPPSSVFGSGEPAAEARGTDR